jgi:Fic family protein
MTMFEPKYTITDAISMNIRRIGELIGEFNSYKFNEANLVKMEHDTRALSSFSSTSIEGNPLPLTEVKRILKSKPTTILDTEREVLNYNGVLEMLDELIKGERRVEISKELICKVQGMVVEGLLAKRYVGVYREEPVFVNDPRRNQTIFLPPDVADVEVLMNELINYVMKNEGTADPLIVAGVFHKQMVIIHPFMDGNGRTTRLITKVLLAKLGINTFPLFSFENFYNENVTKYFQKVGVFGNYYDISADIDFTQWLEYFTEGIINELNRVKSQLPKYKVRLKDYQKKILQYIEKYGSINSSEYEKISGRARSTRIKDFKELVDLNIITPMGKGKSTYYVIA